MGDRLPEIRCPRCRRLLFLGKLYGAIRCGKCGADLTFDGTVAMIETVTKVDMNPQPGV